MFSRIVKAAIGQQPIIPLTTLTTWVKAAVVCGVQIEPILREAGIEADLSRLDAARVPPDAFLQVLQAGVEQTRSPEHHYPFVLGESFAFEFMPELETFIATSTTVRTALRAAEWARRLINPLMHISLAERGDEARLVLDFDFEHIDQAPQYYVTEATLAGLLKLAKRLLPPWAKVRAVHWRHPAPAHAHLYEKQFDGPSFFGQAENAIVFDRQLLDWRLQGAFPELNQQAEKMVEQRLEQNDQPTSLHERIEARLLAEPTLLHGGIEACAEVLSLHPRTLQRRLKDEDTNFAEIAARVRLRLAMAWLESGELDIEAISERLGYSDRRAFTLAFKRLSGFTPSQYREQAKRGSGA
ncbi:MAG: AraC family transcriptional regulator [Aquabacterium sp.]|nr:MAG: AraC family transcriptional regulator [Aquabacterium sp.]